MPITNSYNSQVNYSDTTAVIATPAAAPYRNYTAGLPWYGSPIQTELWLGNGTDSNLAWQPANGLVVLGPATAPADPYNPSQFQYPACTCWIQGADGAYYGAGNVALPLRIWSGEPPNLNYTINEGLKTLVESYKDLQVPERTTAITALGLIGNTIVAHVNLGPPIALVNLNRSEGGWKFDQRPLQANASALTPNCMRDSKISPFYLGSDLEIYSRKAGAAYNRLDWRDTIIVTDKASSKWNSQATKPATGTDYFIIYDEKNGRLWLWIQMAITGRNILYCYDQRASAINGPWHMPDFLAVFQLNDDQSGCIVAGITREGAFLWADLGLVGNMPDTPYNGTLSSNYGVFLSPPSVTPGIPYVGVDATGLQFMEVLHGVPISMVNPFADWTLGAIQATRFFMNARVSVIELSEADFGFPDVIKEFVNLRTLWNINSIVYAGLYSSVNGYQYGGYRGLFYPNDSWEAAIGGMGATAKLRLILITFNDQPARLLAVTPEFQISGEN